MRRNILLLFLTLTVLSCSNDDAIVNDVQRKSEPINVDFLRSMIMNPMALNYDQFCYVKKESNSFSNLDPKLSVFAYDKDSSARSFAVNNLSIPQTKQNTFNYFLGALDSKEFITESYAFNFMGTQVALTDVDVNLVQNGGPISVGTSLDWITTGRASATILAIKENSVKLDGRVVERPSYVYKLIESGNSYRIDEDLLSNFSTGDEIMISVGVVNYVDQDGVLFAVGAIDHSSVFTVSR
jgi:hypothetical protein